MSTGRSFWNGCLRHRTRLRRADFPVGLYSGGLAMSSEGFPTDYPALGYMDSTGRLWGLQYRRAGRVPMNRTGWCSARLQSGPGGLGVARRPARSTSSSANAASFFVAANPPATSVACLQGFAEARVDDPAPDSAVGQEWISSPLPAMNWSTCARSRDLFVPTFSQRIFAGIDYARLRVDGWILCLALEESLPPERECTGEISCRPPIPDCTSSWNPPTQ